MPTQDHLMKTINDELCGSGYDLYYTNYYMDRYKKPVNNDHEADKEWYKLTLKLKRHGLVEDRKELTHSSCRVKIRHWTDLKLNGIRSFCIEIYWTDVN